MEAFYVNIDLLTVATIKLSQRECKYGILQTTVDIIGPKVIEFTIYKCPTNKPLDSSADLPLAIRTDFLCLWPFQYNIWYTRKSSGACNIRIAA